MSKSEPTVRLETLLLIGLLLLAGGLRLTALDWPPMSSAEAAPALEAASGTPEASAFWSAGAIPGTNSIYQLLTSISFQFVGASSAGARLIPVLFGIGLVLIPLLLQRQIGRTPALLASLLLALSPAGLLASRSAGSGIIAISLLALGLALLHGLYPRWLAWAALGAALAGGSTVWTGLLGLLLGWGFARLLGFGGRLIEEKPASVDRWRGVWVIPLAMLVSASGVGLYPQGLAALFQSLSSWLVGWSTAGDFPSIRALVSIPIYEPLLLVMGFLGIYHALRGDHPFPRLLGGWMLGSFVILIIYPARQPLDLLWVLLPLALLAGIGLERVIAALRGSRSWGVLISMTGTFLVLVAFAYLQLAAYSVGQNPNAASLYLGLVGAALLLCLLVGVFFGLGWSWRLAGAAGGLATSLILLALTISAGWRLVFGSSGAGELWRLEAATTGLEYLVDTVEAVSLVELGQLKGLPLQVDQIPPVLAWYLRDFTRANPAQAAPALILMPESSPGAQVGGDYLGQTLTIIERPGWAAALPSDPIRWWLRREAPRHAERWLLLVRADIASLGTLTSTGDPIQP